MVTWSWTSSTSKIFGWCPAWGVARPASVPAERKARKDAMLAECSALLVVGSSVAVMSSYKIVLEALRAGKPVAIINGGPGRADTKATFLWRTGVGEALELMLDAIDG